MITGVFLLLADRRAPAALAIATASPQCQATGNCGLKLKGSGVVLLLAG